MYIYSQIVVLNILLNLLNHQLKEQYVYVKRVQPYGIKEVVDENNVEETKKIVDLFKRALALPTSPIKTHNPKLLTS